MTDFSTAVMDRLQPTDVVTAIDVLCSPPQSSPPDSTTSTEMIPSAAEMLAEQLQKKLAQLRTHLQGQGHDDLLSVLQRAGVFSVDHSDESTEGNSANAQQWQFVLACLKLLETLHSVLTHTLEIYTSDEQEEEKTLSEEQLARRRKLEDNTAPRMSPDTFSFQQQKVLRSCIQLVFSLCVLPALAPGVGVPLHKRTGFPALVRGATPAGSGGEWEDGSVVQHLRLVVCMQHLLQHVLPQPALSELLLSQHLPDLLAALCQIVFAPRTPQLRNLIQKHKETKQCAKSVSDGTNVPTGSTKAHSESGGIDSPPMGPAKPGSADPMTCISTFSMGETICIETLLEGEMYCNKQLGHLVGKLYPPLLLRELIQLQGAGTDVSKGVKSPAWLKRACGRLLSDTVIKPDGVNNLICGMLHDTEDLVAGMASQSMRSVDWKTCEAVGNIIAHCPRSMSVDDYYSKVGPQVIDLLHCVDQATRKQFVPVAASTMMAMLNHDAEMAKRHVLLPILQPLLNCTAHQEICRQEKATILVGEQQLGRCVDDIYQVLLSGRGRGQHPLVQQTLQALLQPVFCLLCLSHTAALNLRGSSEEILVMFLRYVDNSGAVGLLRAMVYDDKDTDMVRLHNNVMFSPGPTGGAVVITKPTVGSCAMPASDDMEVRCACMVQLMKKLNDDTLMADFFLSLLNSLTELISDRIDSDKQTVLPPTRNSGASGVGETCADQRHALLDLETRHQRQETKFRDSLLTLHLVALLAEDVGPSFLSKPDHILTFAKITLERAVQVLQNTDDELMGVFESETVTMAMGMLTALMGGAAELSREDKDRMQVVLPLLRQLADQHSDPEVTEMASDLSIAIATRGAVWSDILRDAQTRDRQRQAQQPAEPQTATLHTLKLPSDHQDKVKKEEDKGGVTTKPGRPLIEVISSTDTPESQPETTHKAKPKEEKEEAPKVGGETLDGARDSRQRTELQEALEELLSPLIPVRGHALITLRHLVEQGDTEALRKSDVLIRVFRENLDHHDTYLYLAAIGGLAALAQRKPDLLVPTLAAELADRNDQRKRSAQVRMKLGEVLVKTCRALGDLMPKYGNVVLGALLACARDDDPLVRASAVSNLGDLCQLLRFSLGNIIHEVLNCVTSLIKSDPDVEVRKAAALFTTLLLQGLGKDTTKVLEGTLRDVYRLLKLVLMSERDDVVKMHVRLALDELDTTMRELLFPKQTLTKTIHVLDPPQ